MGRGRVRGHNRRGRGRGGGRGSQQQRINSKDASHIRQFGEQHPSQELGNFGPTTSKRGHCNSRNNKRGRSRGREAGFELNNKSGQQSESDSSSDNDPDELTPYNELLSIYMKKKGNNRNEIHIVSEDDEEELEVYSEDDQVMATTDDDNDDHNAATTSMGENDSKVLQTLTLDMDTNIGHGDDYENEIDEDRFTQDEIDDAEINPEMEDEVNEENEDSFLCHFEREMSEILLAQVKGDRSMKIQTRCSWHMIEKFTFIGLDSKLINEGVRKEREVLNTGINLSVGVRSKLLLLPDPPIFPPCNGVLLESFFIKPQICLKFPIINQKVIDNQCCKTPLSKLQAEILHLSSQYYDAYLPIRSFENSEEIRNTYCLHVANHVLKTRTRVLHHNAKMISRVDVPDSYRDQGFVRPKVLILVPFKESAYRVVTTLLSLFLEDEKGNVANKKRFIEEYSGSTLFLPKTNPKPDDYNATFEGNVEDNFKIGLSLTKKTVKLFTGFYASDVIVASPLGLRLIIGAEGEKDRDYDFLSSIELLIMDQADLFLMQNWDHVLHLMKHMHLQPVTTHGTDFARIRPWTLDGLNKYYCQTLIFSSVYCPEHSALMTKYCSNYAGQIRVSQLIDKGSILDVSVQLPQVFQFFNSSSLQTTDDDRFEFFTKKILPNFTEKLMSHTLIFVSSYFDFVRLRNYFKREQTNFVQICEYTKDKKIARARDYFFHGQGHFLLYTERVHFFRRFRLKGIGHVLFYQLPQFPHFYSELCNFVRDDFQNRRVRQRKNCSVNVIYCKYDISRLAAVIGSERASLMLSSEKNVHAFVSGEL